MSQTDRLGQSLFLDLYSVFNTLLELIRSCGECELTDNMSAIAEKIDILMSIYNIDNVEFTQNENH